MKTIAALFLTLALLGRAEAQLRSDDVIVARSVSGQFQASARRTAVPSRYAIANTNSISLEPAILVVSCERIKQALGDRLGVAPSWKGKVFLNLRPANSPNARVSIIADRGLNGWAYHVELPDSLEQSGLLQAIVQVLLMEMANRQADAHLAEIPLWLTQGLSQELLTSIDTELLLPPPRLMENGVSISRLMVERRRNNPLEQAQKILRARPPLTFEQLSWPAAEHMSGADSDVYRSSAQLFVNQLLNMKGGAACMRAVIAELPRHYNWQFALLKGFDPHFHTLLDVEKWWALQVVQFTGRDLMQTWTFEESLRKLDEIVLSPLNVREHREELPLRTEVSLQTIIRDTDTLRQAQILPRKLAELDFLRLKASPQVIALVDDYRLVLETYLKTPNLSTSLLPVRRQTTKVVNRLAEDTAMQLDVLDGRRKALRATIPTSVADTASATP